MNFHKNNNHSAAGIRKKKRETRAPPFSVQNPATAQLSQGTARGQIRESTPVDTGDNPASLAENT